MVFPRVKRLRGAASVTDHGTLPFHVPTATALDPEPAVNAYDETAPVLSVKATVT